MLWFIKIKINIYNTFILDTSILIENMSWSMFVLKAFVEFWKFWKFSFILIFYLFYY